MPNVSHVSEQFYILHIKSEVTLTPIMYYSLVYIQLSSRISYNLPPPYYNIFIILNIVFHCAYFLHKYKIFWPYWSSPVSSLLPSLFCWVPFFPKIVLLPLFCLFMFLFFCVCLCICICVTLFICLLMGIS